MGAGDTTPPPVKDKMLNISKVNQIFNEKYQTTIEELKKEHSQFSIRTANSVALINNQHDFLRNEIGKYNVYFDFDKMTEFQTGVYYEALVQQLYYILTEFDFTNMTGYDPEHNIFANTDILAKVQLSRIAKGTLTRGGLLYRGLNNNYPYRGCYGLRRF